MLAGNLVGALGMHLAVHTNYLEGDVNPKQGTAINAPSGISGVTVPHLFPTFSQEKLEIKQKNILIEVMS